MTNSDTLTTEETLWQRALSWAASPWVLSAVGIGTGLVMMLSMMMFGALPLWVMIPMAIGGSALTLALGAKSYWSAWQDLKQGKMGMDTLFALSTLTGLAVSFTSFFVPWLPMMFDAGLMIFGFRYLGIALKSTIKERAIKTKYQDRLATSYKKQVNGTWEECPTDAIQADDIIELRSGDVIPVDGILLEDAPIIDTMRGSTEDSAEVTANTRIYSGMKIGVCIKPVTLKAVNTSQNSRLALIESNIQKTLQEKSPLELLSLNTLKWFIPAIIVMALVSGLVVGIFFPPALAVQCALAVLVSACPCTLGMISGLTVETGYRKGLSQGLRFKNSTFLETAEQIDTVVFDLSGTLTTGILTVTQWDHVGDEDPQTLINIIAALEHNVPQPFAAQTYNYFSKKQSETLTLENKTIHAKGVSGYFNSQDYAIGNAAFMELRDVDITTPPNSDDILPDDNFLYVCRNKTLIATIRINAPLRADAKETINTLMRMGKTIHLCTGKDEATAKRYGKALGIDSNNIHFNQYPLGENSKTALIKALKDKGHKVAMVGDGINDAEAVAGSDLGIAMLSKHCDIMTQNNAKLVIFNDALASIPKAFTLSKDTVHFIKQNINISLAYNIASILLASGLLLAFGITLNPAVGVALMAVQACLVLANVYRFKMQETSEASRAEAINPGDNSTQSILKGLGTAPAPEASNTLQEPCHVSVFRGDDSPIEFIPPTVVNTVQ